MQENAQYQVLPCKAIPALLPVCNSLQGRSRRDETPYSFKYLPSHGVNNTTMPGFSIKPLAKIANEVPEDSAGVFAKLGYGNLQNPLAQLAYQSSNKSSDFSVWVDHASAKGKIENQQNDQTSAKE